METQTASAGIPADFHNPAAILAKSPVTVKEERETLAIPSTKNCFELIILIYLIIDKSFSEGACHADNQIAYVTTLYIINRL
jgi:hypothetical protein